MNIKQNICVLANPITVKLTWTVSRTSNNPETPGVVTDSRESIIEANDTDRTTLIQMLNMTSTNLSMMVAKLMPKFIKVTNTGFASEISQLMQANGTSQ